MRITIDIPDDLANQLFALECHDHNCIFKDPRKGPRVGTNGGCQCLMALPNVVRIPTLRVMRKMMESLRKEITQ